MSERSPAATPCLLQAQKPSQLSAQAILQNPGARHFDAAFHHYLGLLATRARAAPEGVKAILEDRLEIALAGHAERFRQAQAAAAGELASLSGKHPELRAQLQQFFDVGNFGAMRRLGMQAAFDKPCAPLARLNQHLQDVMNQDHANGFGEGRGLLGELEGRSELASVRRFRASWSRMVAEDTVEQSVERGPSHAGPLNSHMLMLRSLALMRQLSPDYLQRFLSHMDTLLWLDQANQKLALARPARRTRPRK
jgi:hypothetical protein